MKYDVILADPPWQYEVWGKSNSVYRGLATDHYPTMPINEIAELPIKDLINNNAVLFLWVTWPLLFECKEVVESWGFRYRTIAWVWIKAKRSGFGFYTGMGHYTRANSEPCLLAIRGSMPVERHDIQSLIYSAVRGHSKKPEDQYRKVEALYPDRKYLELFARRERKGWDVWGNEVRSDLELVSNNDGK